MRVCIERGRGARQAGQVKWVMGKEGRRGVIQKGLGVGRREGNQILDGLMEALETLHDQQVLGVERMDPGGGARVVIHKEGLVRVRVGAALPARGQGPCHVHRQTG